MAFKNLGFRTVALIATLSAAACDDSSGPAPKPPAPDELVTVEPGGATVCSRGTPYLVRYQGWSSAFDEWVGPDRIRKPPSAFSPRVQIQWGGSWYPGRIVRQDGYRYLVTYDGWSSTFDEWVDDSRLRFERGVYRPVYRPLPTRQAPTYQKPVKHQRPNRRYR